MSSSIPREFLQQGEFSIDLSGRTFFHHIRSECSGHCPFHNPSKHLMRDMRLTWRGDRGIMERTCKHGVGHPDPDDLTVRTDETAGVHGCDGCCTGNGPKD